MTFPWQTMFSNPPTDQLRLVWKSAVSTVATFDWVNNTSIDLVIARVDLVWPSGNDAIFNMFNKGVMIWSGADVSPPTTITAFAGTVAQRTWLAHEADDVEFFFGTNAEASGYDLLITFDNGWSIRCVQ